MPGIVWVLGAGFNKPLGGPLLPQLLSRGSEIRIRAAFPEATGLFTGAGHEAISNLLFGHGWQTGDPAFRPWQDAEELLELLDRAGFGRDLGSGMLTGRRATGGVPVVGFRDTRRSECLSPPTISWS